MRCVRGGAHVYEATLRNAQHKSWRERWFPNGEWMVLLALIAEIGIFSFVAQNFLTAANFVEVLRLSVELGLLALALTPVIITGGIDLSVGSMMGLCAVAFGALVMDAHWPIPAAAIATLLIGCAGGALNGALIAEFSSQSKLPYEPTTVPLTGAGPSVQRSLMAEVNSPKAGSAVSGL